MQMPAPLIQDMAQIRTTTKEPEMNMVPQHILHDLMTIMRALVTTGYQPLMAHSPQMQNTCVLQQSRSPLPTLHRHQGSNTHHQQQNLDQLLVTVVAVNLLLLRRRMVKFRSMMACRHHQFLHDGVIRHGNALIITLGLIEELVALSVEVES